KTRRKRHVAYRRVSRHLLFLLQPGQRCALIAKLIDQLEIERLAAGEDPAVRNLRQLGIVELAAVLHHAFEPGIGVADERGDRRTGFGAGRLKPARRGLERRGLYAFDVDPDRLQKLGKIRVLEKDTNRADQRGVERDDVI